MHIFLTGEIQVGKSTVITRTLSVLDIKSGGFRTCFGPDRESPDRLLYMNSATEPQVYDLKNAVVRFTKGKPAQVLPNKFDILGTELIRSARANKKLIIMDECGSLEQDALVFQKEIMDCLDDNIPVLGVVKLSSCGWTDLIRNHYKVKLLTVTRENRDTLPQIIVNLLAPEIMGL